MSRKVKDWISGYLEFTENSEPPELYKEWVAISVVASCLQRKVHLVWDTPTYPNMYIVLVGPSGRARKGTAMAPGLDMLQDLGTINLAAESITREALIQELERSSGTEITDEGEMIAHCSLTIYSPELTVFLGYDNKQLMIDLGDWYDCRKRWKHTTKTQGKEDILGVWVNMIGATTPELLMESMPAVAIGGGLASRMIFVYQDRKGKNIPLPFLTEQDFLLRHDLMLDLERIRSMKGEFSLSEDFLQIWVPFYETLDDNPPFKDETFNAYFSRRAKHLLKLCMIISASEGDSMELTAHIFNRALDTLRKVEVPMSKTFRGFGQSDHAAVLVKIMAVLATRKEMSYQEILQMFYRDATLETIEAIIRTMELMKWCRKVINPEKGTTKIVYTKEEE